MDFDNDTLTNPEEVMYEGLHTVDPLVPDTWGFFEQSSDFLVIPYDEIVPAPLSGRFSFYLPQSRSGCTSCGSGGSPPPKFLYIDAYAGEFSNFILDGDATLLKGVTLAADYPDTAPASQFVSSMAPGWHTIEYNYLAHSTSICSNISFRINDLSIQIIDIPELQDTSGSGIKNASKYASGLNPYTQDTDSDGLPDNLESSPTSSLVLDPTKITQVILPTSPLNNTLLSMQVRKPAVDYSTGGGSRVYSPYFYGDVIPNLKVVLALRLFGNSSITRSQLEGTWGKTVQTYSLVPGYNTDGVGDDLPVSGPDSEYTYIMPLAANKSFEYDFNYSRNSEAKNDGNNALDIRFDFVWLVINGSENILHIYDPEEPIVVQSWAGRDVGNITYILGSPTCMVENQALWTLVQNPALGSPGDYCLGTRVVGSGTVDYFDLPAQVLQDRDNHPRNSTDTEVIYVSAFESNLDILKKIRLLDVPNDTFNDLYELEEGLNLFFPL